MSFIQLLKELLLRYYLWASTNCWIVSVDYILSDSKILISVFFPPY